MITPLTLVMIRAQSLDMHAGGVPLPSTPAAERVQRTASSPVFVFVSRAADLLAVASDQNFVMCVRIMVISCVCYIATTAARQLRRDCFLIYCRIGSSAKFVVLV